MQKLVVFLLASLCAFAASPPPNIVLFLADDLGWTGLRCFGSDFYETPNLDQLAKAGVKFTDAYAACTVCSPSRASVMTGKYPARLHLTDFIAGQNRPTAKLKIPDWTKVLKSSETTIAEALKAKGYQTAHIGKWHLEAKSGDAAGSRPTDQGFDYSYARPAGSKGYQLKNGGYLTDDLTDKAITWIDGAQNDPFFVYFAYNVPHTPIDGRKDLVEAFTQKIDAQAIHKNPDYAAMVASLDQSVGRVLKCLDDLKLRDNTLIVFTSDNGGLTQRHGRHDEFTENLPLRRGKGSAYEGGVRVPTIAHWPGVTPSNISCSTPVMTTDWFPTFLRAAGETVPKGIDGRNLLPLLKDPALPIDRDLFWHYPHYHAGGDSPYSAIRSGDWRLIEFHEDKNLALYNLSSDLGEQRNLAESNPAKAQALHKRLLAWRSEVGAQMPTANPNYDPNDPGPTPKNKRR